MIRISVPISMVCVVLLAGTTPATGRAQTTNPNADSAIARNTTHAAAPALRAARRDGDVRIDGRLDDPAWKGAEPVTAFRQRDPNEGEPGSQRTEARVLVDGEAIYVGLRMFDTEPRLIQAQLARRDESVEGDIAEVYLDSYHDHLTGYVFRLSALGAKRDAALSESSQDESWDPVWDGAATIDTEGWSAEFRIPLSQLRYDPGSADHVWGIQVMRKIARKGEVQVLSFTPKTEQSGINTYGHLTGLGRLPAPRQIELVPYVVAKNEHPTAPRNDPFRKRNELAPGMGLDVKYGITSNLTLNATFNPDFGQVEVDPAVVNLSAFETFFPERRPFFVEGASIFGFGAMRTFNSSNGYNFTHTRRIGRSPQRGLGGPNFQFVDAPLETTIAGAAKLTGRTKGGWSIGLLDAVTMQEEARFRTGLGGDSSAVVEPAANYFIGRVKRDLRGGNSTVGVALNMVHRSLGDDALDPLFRTSAYAAGFDWNHAWAKREWSFDGAIVMTRNNGSPAAIDALQLSPARYYQRPDRRSDFHRDPTRTSLTGHMAEASLAKLAGKHWRFSLTAQDYHPGFEINEMGFESSADMRGLAPLIGHVETQPGKVFRFRESFLFWNPTWNYDGDMTFNGVGTLTFLQTKNFWGIFGRLDWRPPVIDDRLTRGGPVGVIPAQFGWGFELTSDSRKKHTFGVFINRFVSSGGGWSQFFGPNVALKPSPAVRVRLSPTFFKARRLAQYVTTQADANAADTYGARYVFSTIAQNELSMQTRVDWTFTPRLSLQVFAQPLISSGDFMDFKELARPRQFNFDVYGRDIGTITRDPATAQYSVDPDGLGSSPTFNFRDPDFNQRFLRGNALLRWEYRPGSVLFFVWQQSRFGSIPQGTFEPGRDIGELWA
ncbi:MAG: DUF5916 domain-containing protein, partial [Gemmatimonadaceae bacterium]